MILDRVLRREMDGLWQLAVAGTTLVHCLRAALLSAGATMMLDRVLHHRGKGL